MNAGARATAPLHLHCTASAVARKTDSGAGPMPSAACFSPDSVQSTTSASRRTFPRAVPMASGTYPATRPLRACRPPYRAERRRVGRV